MGVDIHASDPAFGSVRRQGEHVEELIAFAREKLGVQRPWTLISSRMKLGKTLFEVEDDGRRIIGKVSKSKRAEASFEILERLWDAGLQPPSRWVVVEPIAWFPERRLLLQAKARGTQLVELLGDPGSAEAAAAWLSALRATEVRAAPAPVELPVIERCARELEELLPGRVRAIADELAASVEHDAAAMVPSHGDYHPMNLYVAGDGTVTAIDLDTFACREPAADIGYLVAQTAILSYHVHGAFEHTRDFRRRFLKAAPPAPEDRIHWHVRLAFLRSLHYDLCILKTGNTAMVEPFLAAARSGLPA